MLRRTIRTQWLALLLLCLPASSLTAAGIEDLLPTGEPSAALTMARSLAQSTFRVEGGRCYAAEKSIDGKAICLGEFIRPHLSFQQAAVGETDQLNGVTESYTLHFSYGHKRIWDGKWSEWDGGDPTLGTTWTFQKKNGEWKTLFAAFLNPFIQDEAERDAQVAEANGIPRSLPTKTADQIFSAIRLGGLFSGPKGPQAVVNKAMIGVGGHTFVRIDGVSYKVTCTAIVGSSATFEISGTGFSRTIRL